MSRTRYVLLVDINPALSILGQPPDAVLGAAYSFTFTFFGGAAPYACTVVGSVPSGWTFDAATGVLSHPGPSTPGPLSLTLKLRDADYRETSAVTYAWSVIALPLQLTGDAPNGTHGTAYSYTYSATGGVPPYTWSVVSGALPSGLSLNASTGALSGTPSANGTYTWTVRVSDAAAGAVDLADSATMAYPTLTLSGTYAAATAGTAYSSDLTIAGGNGAYSSPRVTSGSLPTGLSLSIVGSALRLSGTPTASGTYAFTAAVDSGDGQTATSAQSVAVYATFNPANKSTYIILSGGNLVAERSTGTGYASVRATGKMLATNKTQCEFVITHVGLGPYVIVGIDDGTANISASFQIASDVHGYGYYQDTGEKIHSNTLSTYGASFKTDGDVITMLYDGPSGTLAFKKNGVSQGVAYSGLSGDFFPAISIYSGSASPTQQITLRTNPAAMSYPESGYVGVTE